MSNIIGGAQGNTGTVIIGKNPIIDNPLDPWWDIQGAVNAGGNQINSDVKTVNSISHMVSSAGGIFSSFTSFAGVLSNGTFWKGIGLVLAGVLILLVIGIQLVKA